MYVVRKDVNGEIDWDEKIEIESLEAFASQQKMTLREIGLDRESFSVVSPRSVEHRNGHGKLVETYHLCQKSGCDLI
jgi:hypothetical protein